MMNNKVKGEGKNVEVKCVKRKGGGQSRIRFSLSRKFEKRGVAQSPKIFNTFYSDISPITKKSSRLVSHFRVNRLLSM